MFNKVIILSKHITKKPRRKKKRWSPESTSVWTLESYTLPGVGVGSCEPKTLVLFPSCADAAPVLDRFLRMATAPFMCNLSRLWAEQGLTPSRDSSRWHPWSSERSRCRGGSQQCWETEKQSELWDLYSQTCLCGFGTHNINCSAEGCTCGCCVIYRSFGA